MTDKRLRGLDGLAVLLLFCLLALLTLGVMTAGVSVYQRVTDRAAANFDQRTALSYLVNRTRQADAGGVSLSAEGLALRETIDGYDYITDIYCYDGAIRESFAEAGYGLPPESGQAILPAQELTVAAVHDRLLRFTVTDGLGRQHQVLTALRSEGGDGL